MNPRLFAIAGPLEGAFFALPEQEVSIGRGPSNLLVIDDPSVAPEHCLIRGSGEEFRLRDLGSPKGTYVNALPVEERLLRHGDEIRVGECLFLFLLYEAETPPELRRERELEWLTAENRRLLAEINLEHNMVGESPAMRAVFQLISRVAPTDSTILICGESGTGKELVARAIHRNSPRAAHAFVAINCAALTETLLESELFGHEKGAFTGAVVQKRGKLEVADGGTVFLDEIAELTPAFQAKLLRVLEEHEFERVGGVRTIPVNLRVLAATNKDLTEAVRRGAFRPDLYYRLNVVALTMPPLRERKADIPSLASYFAAKYARRSRRQVLGVSPEALALLAHYDWPGNVRELENAIERAVVLGSTELILPEDLPEALLEAQGNSGLPTTTYHEAVGAAKRQVVLRALEQAGGNYTEAARLLGLHPNNLHRLIRNLDLRASLKKSGNHRG
jgi:transcriptional regulator with GAF, ATPase, and Fis domain